MTNSFARRYLHIAGAVASGGWFPAIGPKKIDVPMPTVASLHLAEVGGVAEAQQTGIEVTCKGVDFGDVSAEERTRLESRVLMTLARGSSRLATTPRLKPDDPAQSTTHCEFTNLSIDGLYVQEGLLNMQMFQAPSDPYPHIQLGDTHIIGFSLGGYPLEIVLDTASFNEYDTLPALEAAYEQGKLPPELMNCMTIAKKEREAVPYSSGYVVASIVSKISGTLPPGASIEPNGYTIDWEGFGKIHLGEIIMSRWVRRVTLVRIHRCDGEHGSGCSGGTYYP